MSEHRVTTTCEKERLMSDGPPGLLRTRGKASQGRFLWVFFFFFKE